MKRKEELNSGTWILMVRLAFDETSRLPVRVGTYLHQQLGIEGIARSACWQARANCQLLARLRKVSSEHILVILHHSSACLLYLFGGDVDGSIVPADCLGLPPAQAQVSADVLDLQAN